MQEYSAPTIEAMERELPKSDGLHVRLLLGKTEYEHEEVTGADYEPEMLRSFNATGGTLADPKKKYEMYGTVSVNERREGDLNTSPIAIRKDKWALAFFAYIKSNAKMTTPEGVEILKKCGIQPGFKVENLVSWYNTYFGADGKKADIRLFVENVLKGYSSNKQSVDIKALYKDLEILYQLSGVFGEQSADMILSLIVAEGRAAEDVQQLIPADSATQPPNKLAAHKDNLADEDKKLLDFINKHKHDPLITSPIDYIQIVSADQVNKISAQAKLLEEKPAVKVKIDQLATLPEEKFGVSQEENKRAADQFVKVLRDPELLEKSEDNWGFVHAFGFKVNPNPLQSPDVVKNNGKVTDTEIQEKGWFVVNPYVMQERYNMPMAFYVAEGHAMLVLKAPEQRNNGWYLTYYDPFFPGSREIRMPESNNIKNKEDILLSGKSHIYTNGLWEHDFKSTPNNIDISFDGLNIPTSYREHFKDAKLAQFQDNMDFSNCVLYSCFVGVLLNALKTGDTDFKSKGIAQIKKDFGIKVLKREELIA